jgi:hypothetical protein
MFSSFISCFSVLFRCPVVNSAAFASVFVPFHILVSPRRVLILVYLRFAL